VGQRRATGDHHAVEAVLGDLFGDVLDAVLRAGVEVVLGVHHAGQRPRVLGHAGHVQVAANVRPAMTDEDADAWLFAAHVALWRELRRHAQRETGRAQPRRRRRCRAAGLDHRLRNILRLAEGADGVDTGAAGLQRVEEHRMAEAILVQFDPQPAAQVAHLRTDLHAHREHGQVEALCVQRAVLVLVAQD